MNSSGIEPSVVAKWDPALTKQSMRLIRPIVKGWFGDDPDVDEVNVHVRHVTQRALDTLAAERRLPVVG